MGEHTEWVRARDAIISYEEHHDASVEGPALLIGIQGAADVAVEGTPEELVDFANRMVTTVINSIAATAERPLSRAEKVIRIAEQNRPWNDPVADWLAEVHQGPERWLLVEQSNITHEYEFSLHEDMETATAYSAEQECAEDWDPLAVYDLDDGIRYALRRGYATLQDEFHGVEKVTW